VPWWAPILGRAFASAIVVIPYPADGCKPGEHDDEWLPRRTRLDSATTRNLQTAGTPSPPFPGGACRGRIYSLTARQRSLARVAAGSTVEQAARDCLDADCVADASTIRRWAWRIRSLPFWLAARPFFARPPSSHWVCGPRLSAPSIPRSLEPGSAPQVLFFSSCNGERRIWKLPAH